jgi:hypothetical protein
MKYLALSLENNNEMVFLPDAIMLMPISEQELDDAYFMTTDLEARNFSMAFKIVPAFVIEEDISYDHDEGWVRTQLDKINSEPLFLELDPKMLTEMECKNEYRYEPVQLVVDHMGWMHGQASIDNSNGLYLMDKNEYLIEDVEKALAEL